MFTSKRGVTRVQTTSLTGREALEELLGLAVVFGLEGVQVPFSAELELGDLLAFAAQSGLLDVQVYGKCQASRGAYLPLLGAFFTALSSVLIRARNFFTLTISLGWGELAGGCGRRSYHFVSNFSG